MDKYPIVGMMLVTDTFTRVIYADGTVSGGMKHLDKFRTMDYLRKINLPITDIRRYNTT